MIPFVLLEPLVATQTRAAALGRKLRLFVLLVISRGCLLPILGIRSHKRTQGSLGGGQVAVTVFVPCLMSSGTSRNAFQYLFSSTISDPCQAEK
jgi:hypothetical protein